jgi:hypothetical protein
MGRNARTHQTKGKTMYQTPQPEVEAKFMERALTIQLKASLKTHLLKAINEELVTKRRAFGFSLLL